MSHQDPFQELVDVLRRALTTSASPPSPAITSTNTVTSPSPPVHASPMAKPAPYSGSAEDCSGFLLQCALVLEMQPHLYPNDTAKVAFIISQLQGKALQWADSIWSQNSPVIQSYSTFVSHFREVFGKPVSDSSIGEKLYNLKQGSMSVNDYALQFRTLALSSGWNEQALITTYWQGLDPRVRLHLAAYEDSIVLERFIQLSIRFASRMQSCIEEHQVQPLFNTLLRRSEPVSPPEPANEPMQVENSRLSTTERQRRLTLNLCLYCGSPGHVISTCPTRPPRPMVSAIIPSLNKMKPLTTFVNLTAADVSIPVVALLDSGSAGNFISGALCRQLKLKTSPSPTIYQIHSITGKPLSRRQVRRCVGPIQLRVGALHLEDIHLLILEESTSDVVLGRPWLEQHNPTISWKTGEILKWGETCFSNCFSELPVPRSPPSKDLSICTTSIESPVEKRSVDIPACYTPFSDIFCPQQASKLPPHRPWDCAINLLPVSQCPGEGSTPCPSQRRRPWRNTSKRPLLKDTSARLLPLLLRASSLWQKRTEA
ncbi:Retrotransposon-derived protein PEG10 [Anabarilius grahami]|uniref:Retrotransposon-derived protein PEG10 n=1 Tax=Anabarilius grahami TaxID=495550 RepID=A0A3N0YW31_ANAGA|nr:Retrotransposon-derived protein PEG10 [Anabarilius grahami]